MISVHAHAGEHREALARFRETRADAAVAERASDDSTFIAILGALDPSM